MTSPEHTPKKEKKEKLDSKKMDSIFARTGEQLHEIFRKGYHEADIENSIVHTLFGTRYPADRKAAEEAFLQKWDASGRLAEDASKEELERALQLLDSAVAIHNEPEYRKAQQDVVRRLKEMEEKSHIK